MILLKKVPPEALKVILTVQAEVKLQKGVGSYSQEKAIYKIISDYEKLKSSPTRKQAP